MFFSNGFFLGIWMYNFAEWTSMGSENSWTCNKYLNVWPMISFSCCKKSMFLLIYFVKKGRTVVSASWIICNFFLAFPNFTYLSSHTPPYLLVNCSILESPKKSEPWSDQLRDPEDIFPPENLSFHLSWPSLSECRNDLSLLLLLILCAWGLIWIEAISQDASAAPVLHSLQPLGLFSLLHVFTLFEISVQQLWCLWHSSLNQGLQLVALNILPCTGLFGRSLWQRTFF